MNDLFVYDRYKTVSEAEVAAEQLLALGVPRQVIALGAERDLSHETAQDFALLKREDFQEADEHSASGLWDRIMNFFQSEDESSTDAADIEVAGYRSALALGDVLLLVEEEYRGIIEHTIATDELDGGDKGIPTEADERISQGRSFSSEELNFHQPTDIEIPHDEWSNEDDHKGAY